MIRLPDGRQGHNVVRGLFQTQRLPDARFRIVRHGHNTGDARDGQPIECERALEEVRTRFELPLVVPAPRRVRRHFSPDVQEPAPVNPRFPLPEPWSCRGPLPRTLVFGSVGDHTDAVESWFGPDGRRDYEVAIVYYGNDPGGPWANRLRRSADHFAVHAGASFPNLLWWTDQNPHVLPGVDYVVVADDDIAMTPERVGGMVRTARAYGLPVASASHGWEGKVSGWRHMMARGGGGARASSPPGAWICATSWR